MDSFTPYDATHTTTLSPPLHPIISTFSATAADNFSLLVAHGGIVSRYHPTTLSHLSSTRTHLDHISSLLPVSHKLSAVSSNSFSSPPGLQLFGPTSHVGTVFWSDPSDPRTDKSRVTAMDSDGFGVGCESSRVFGSFDCRHGENAVLVVDLCETRVVSVIGRQSGNSARSSALTKLRWVDSLGVLVGISVTCGGFGYSGYIRVWDVRSGKEVWETGEPGGSAWRGNRAGDTMADVDVDVEGLYMAKVGSRTGDVGVADLRMLGDDPWVYLEEPNPGLRSVGPVRERAVVNCWKRDVYVARDGALEAWSSVKGGIDWGRYRRNYMDKEEDEKRGIVREIGGGGSRLFVVRENVEGVEVWESSCLSGVVLIS